MDSSIEARVLRAAAIAESDTGGPGGSRPGKSEICV